MTITSRIELFGPVPDASESRIFHATEDGLMTLCDTPKSTAGMIAPAAGSDEWPPDVGTFGSECPQCSTNVSKLQPPK